MMIHGRRRRRAPVGGITLEDLPDDTFSTYLFPLLPIMDLLSLGGASKRLRSMTVSGAVPVQSCEFAHTADPQTSESLWQYLLAGDHQHAPSFLLDPSNRPLPPKAIYRGLHKPRAYLLFWSDFNEDPSSSLLIHDWPGPCEMSLAETPNFESNINYNRLRKQRLAGAKSPYRLAGDFLQIVESDWRRAIWRRVGRTASGEIYDLRDDWRNPPGSMKYWAREGESFASLSTSGETSRIQIPFRVEQLVAAGGYMIKLDTDNVVWVMPNSHYSRVRTVVFPRWAVS